MNVSGYTVTRRAVIGAELFALDSWRRWVWGRGCSAAVMLLISLSYSAAFATDLQSRIATLLQKPAAQRAFWGIKVVEIETGTSLYEHNADKLFIPASNAKLLSTALGLTTLGPDYRFVTSVVSDVQIDQSGVLAGDIVLLGGGDPNLSSRLVPYHPLKTFDKDVLRPISDLARQVLQAGVRRIEGDVIGDDTRYVWQGPGEGWSVDDPTWGYGAPISALSFNDNLVRLRVLPGTAVGRPARVDLRPDLSYYSLENRVRTAASRRVAQGLKVNRDPGSRTVSMWGEISIRSRGREIEVAIDDPALFAAMALKSELERLGVGIRGDARVRHTHPHEFPTLKQHRPPKAPQRATTLAGLESEPMSDAIKVINKVSQNLHAEMLLREVGLVRRGVGSFEAGLAELKALLLEAGLKPWEFKIRDASGLSRQNLVTPSGMVRLLQHMWLSPHRDSFSMSLPLAGEDGTLDWRFSRSAARGRIRAKTGSLTGVTALSGYATAKDSRLLAFSILVNNFGVPNSYIQKLVDAVCEAMVEASLPPAPVTSAPERAPRPAQTAP